MKWIVPTLLPLAAAAWPVDAYVDVEAGAEKFLRPSALEWAEVEDPKIASAERLEGGELMVTGVAPGRTLMMLYAEGRIAVWRVRVAAKGAKPKEVAGRDEHGAALKACPGLSAADLLSGPSSPGVGLAAMKSGLEGPVKNEKCRQALLALFQTDAFAAPQIGLEFEVPALQAQLKSMEFPKGIEAKYLGAGLLLTGKATAAEHRKALWTVFKKSVGRVALDDRVEITP